MADLVFMPSWLGGLCFGFGGFFIVHIAHPNMIIVACWLPFLLMVYERMILKNSFFWALLAATLHGLVALGAYPQVNILMSGLIGAYLCALLPAYLKLNGLGRFSGLLRFAGLFGVGFGVAGLIAAVQILPTAELSRHSTYAEKSYEFASSFGCKPSYLLMMVCPKIFLGRVVQGDLDWWQGSYGYLGLMPILLILAGLPSVLARRRGRFLMAAALFSVFLALSNRSIWHDISYAFVPILGSFRAAGRWCLVWSFCLSISAAMALDGLRPGGSQAILQGSRVWMVVALVVTVLCIFVCLGHAGRRQELDEIIMTGLILAAGGVCALAISNRFNRDLVLVAIAATDLLSCHNWRFPHPFVKDPPYGPTPKITELAQASGGLDRMWSSLPPGHAAWPANAGVVYQIPSLQGYVNLPIGMHQAIMGLLDSPARDAVLDLLGVRVLLLPSPKGTGKPQDARIEIVERSTPFPRFWFCDRVRVVARPDEALNAIKSGQMDLTREAVVIADISMQNAFGSVPGSGSIRLESFSASKVAVVTESDQTALMVMSDLAYPGWKAYCDEKPVSLLRADYCLRGVVVPKGQHHVRFEYAPMSFCVGAILSSLACLVSLLILSTKIWLSCSRP